MSTEDRVISPIARVENNFPTKFGLPRQSGLAPVRSRIVFEKKYSVPEAFREIEGFSHLWVIWGFEEKEGEFSPTVRPPMLGGNKRVGVFASRSPVRPNGLGLSVVRLEKAELDSGKCILTVSGSDFMDGTPVYDVKPYLAYVDCVPGAVDGFAEEKKKYSLNVRFDCDLSALSEIERRELSDALSRDPRPQYHTDDRLYGMKYAGKEIKFTVNGGELTVKEII